MSNKISFEKWSRIIPNVPEVNCPFLEEYLEDEQINFLIKNDLDLPQNIIKETCALYNDLATSFNTDTNEIRKEKVQKIYSFVFDYKKNAAILKKVNSKDHVVQKKVSTPTKDKKTKIVDIPVKKAEVSDFSSELIVFEQPTTLEKTELVDATKNEIEKEKNGKKDTNKLQVICKRCGKKTPSDKSKCLFCGEQLKKYVLKKKKICSQCKFETTEFENSYEFTFCPECETELVVSQFESEVSNFENNDIKGNTKNILSRLLKITKTAPVTEKPPETEEITAKDNTKSGSLQVVPETKNDSLNELKKITTICNELPQKINEISIDVSEINKLINSESGFPQKIDELSKNISVLSNKIELLVEILTSNQ